MTPGDVRGVARVLSARYELMTPVWRRYLALEDRFEDVAGVIGQARQGHITWLEQAFAPLLPRAPGPLRARRVAALFAATEIYVWWSWRAKLGLDAKQAERTMTELLEALVKSWRTAPQR